MQELFLHRAVTVHEEIHLPTRREPFLEERVYGTMQIGAFFYPYLWKNPDLADPTRDLYLGAHPIDSLDCHEEEDGSARK